MLPATGLASHCCHSQFAWTLDHSWVSLEASSSHTNPNALSNGPISVTKTNTWGNLVCSYNRSRSKNLVSATRTRAPKCMFLSRCDIWWLGKWLTSIYVRRLSFFCSGSRGITVRFEVHYWGRPRAAKAVHWRYTHLMTPELDLPTRSGCLPPLCCLLTLASILLDSNWYLCCFYVLEKMHYSSPTRILVWNAAHSQWYPCSSNPVSLRESERPAWSDAYGQTRAIHTVHYGSSRFLNHHSSSRIRPTMNNILTTKSLQKFIVRVSYKWGSSKSDTIRLHYIERIMIPYFLYTSVSLNQWSRYI